MDLASASENVATPFETSNASLNENSSSVKALSATSSYKLAFVMPYDAANFSAVFPAGISTTVTSFGYALVFTINLDISVKVGIH